jgi:hypothetical protein
MLAKERGCDKKSQPCPFKDFALEFYKLNLAIIPCDIKKPLVKWAKYQGKKPSRANIYRWRDKHPSSNIAIITGKISNLIVIDCDNLNLSIKDLENEFGNSDFIVKTPKGGYHLYYQYNKEKTITNYQGRKIDIRGDGGLIITPFSFNKDRQYQIIKGKLEDLTNLQEISNRINNNDSDFYSHYLQHRNSRDCTIENGQRNIALFHELKFTAKSKRSYESLLEYAFNFNNFRFEKPLLESEIIATTKKIWQYKEEEKLFNKSIKFTDNALKLAENKNAVLLYIFLAKNHGNYRKEFFIAEKPVSKMLLMSKNTLRNAIKFILDKGFLTREKKENEKISKTKQIKAFSYVYRFT